MHVRSQIGGFFKVQFTCIMIPLLDGKFMRAMVTSVAEIGSPSHIIAGLILENGTVIQKPISRIDFLAAQANNQVIHLCESPDVGNSKLALFGANGRVLEPADTSDGRKVS